ncbi:LOW QUALITY PROTEIN: transcription factor AP-2-epsilon isoform X2 [Vespula squamosa]|uniref:Transcription factor AP-2-epsilon isoform X2 n=1 Tax=Vespula squamosa TaxID=30214 RepID=A0ABD2ADP1_VESSQ
MSILEGNEADKTTMSPLDEVVSPTSVESELMVTDMLEEHEANTLADQRDGKRKRDTDGEELTPRKLPSLTRNNNDVAFVLEDSADDELQDERDDSSRILREHSSFHSIKIGNHNEDLEITVSPFGSNYSRNSPSTRRNAARIVCPFAAIEKEILTWRTLSEADARQQIRWID